jgi:hypothetical protein
MVKKRVVRRKVSKSPQIDIKVRNLDEACKIKKVKYANSGCKGFWIFGSALAMIISYAKSSSILWAILHGILSWFYVLYRAMQIWGWF